MQSRQIPRVALLVGDLVRVHIEAVCTSTNPWLSLQAGTGGSVQLEGGHGIQELCDQIVAAEQARTGRRYLPMGSAHSTAAGALPCKALIHCVAIDAFHGSSVETIMDCVENALAAAAGLGLREVAMPVFATGHGRFPFEDALASMISALQTHAGGFVHQVLIVVPDIDRAEKALAMLEEAFFYKPLVYCQPHERYDHWVAALYTRLLRGGSVGPGFDADAVVAEADVHGVRYLLWVPNWRHRIVGAWLAGVKGYRHLAPLIGDPLVRGEYDFAGEGYCFALARFGDQASADFLTGYLDKWLPETDSSLDRQDWALAALEHVDACRGTALAARYLAPGGPWEQFGWDRRFDLERTRERLQDMLSGAEGFDRPE